VRVDIEDCEIKELPSKVIKENDHTSCPDFLNNSDCADDNNNSEADYKYDCCTVNLCCDYYN
jgi:hypothetical protein